MLRSTFLTFAGVISSLVGFIAQEAGAEGWGFYAADRAGPVLVALGLVTALVFERRANVIILSAQVLAGLTAFAFLIVAVVKYYSGPSFPGASLSAAITWGGEADLFAIAALAFGLTLERRRSGVAMVALAAAVCLTVGCGIYALTQKEGFASYVWWFIAGIGAFIAAAAAAGLERGGGYALGAPVAGGASGGVWSDAGAE